MIKTMFLGLIFLLLLVSLIFLLFLVFDSQKDSKKRLLSLKKKIMKRQGYHSFSLRGIEDKERGELLIWLTRQGIDYHLQNSFNEFSLSSFNFYLENNRIEIYAPGITKTVEGKVIAFRKTKSQNEIQS